MAVQQGMSQQTPAVQSMLRVLSTGVRSAAKRRVRKAATKLRSKARKRTGSKKLKRLVKGSAAAKAYMAKIRRKRK